MNIIVMYAHMSESLDLMILLPGPGLREGERKRGMIMIKPIHFPLEEQIGRLAKKNHDSRPLNHFIDEG